ncbi:MAG: response regulator, partial [Lachnospiraceae bacterium]|nr:response regulator [Lachnospiraceae bacterium]
MDFETFGNIYMLFTAVFGLLLCLFRYVQRPNRAYLFTAFFFLAHILSDYYWTIYTLVMHDDPDPGALMAYFGWNLGYIFLVALAIEMAKRRGEKFFHPLCLVPIPINIAQFFLYMQYGGLFNNAWQGIFETIAMCITLNNILYYLRSKRKGKNTLFPFADLFIFLYGFTEYAMYTASCFDWPSLLQDPYSYFSMINYTINLALVWGVGKQICEDENSEWEKSAMSLHFQMVVQAMFSVIILGGCVGGYLLAKWMQENLASGYASGQEGSYYNVIYVVLFVVSVFMAVIVFAMMMAVAYIQNVHHRRMDALANQEIQIAGVIPDTDESADGEKAEEPAGEAKEQQRDSVFETADLLSGNTAEKKLIGLKFGRHDKNVAEEKRGMFNFVFPLLSTFVLMLFLMIYTSRILYAISVTNLYEVGLDKGMSVSANLKSYLEKTETTLWVAADTVYHMMSRGDSHERICEYITSETDIQAKENDENYTGIYGYINGEYLDGLGWVPPEDYDPQQRDWYLLGMKNKGKITIVPPYVDAQTGGVVITICKSLDDGQSVVSLDVTMNHIQEIVEDVTLKGKGYALVFNDDGTIVAHSDKELSGTKCVDLLGAENYETILSKHDDMFHIKVNGQKYTVFVNDVMEQWYSMIMVPDAELLSDIKIQMVVVLAVYLVIFFLIGFFYYAGYRNEQVMSRKVEEYRVSRQRQEYEARMLKLEKRSADEANKAKSSFLADMSHEIRTPINAVLGMNEMILRESGELQIKEYAKNIQSSGRALLALINSILDFSKIEDGKMEIVPAEYQTRAMLQYLVASISQRAKNKGLNFVLKVDEKLPRVMLGDDMRITQIIMNLLTNAVKYTREGSVTLSVTQAGRDGGNIDLRVEVADTGIGIREEDMPKLYQSFERLDMEKNRNIEGTGLGMAIVTRLLNMMDSKLDLESEYGKGSVFSFVIRQQIIDPAPIGKVESGLEGNLEIASEETYQESFRAPDAKVLVVDDTSMNLIVVKSLLKKTLIQIDTADNGQDAVRLAGQKAYDIILMDQRMPGMDGSQALGKIREICKANLETPVICLTADAISGARERYIAEGFTDYLTKPVDGDALERMMLRYLPA